MESVGGGCGALSEIKVKRSTHRRRYQTSEGGSQLADNVSSTIKNFFRNLLSRGDVVTGVSVRTVGRGLRNLLLD